MLDSETKRRIDSARDILVGKVPDPKSQVEQITIALIYKFMDDMDRESVEVMKGKRSFFKGEYEKYGWGNIFDPRLGGVEMLNLYGEAITRMSQNANLPELFRNIFKNAYLPYRDPETLKLFLKTINGFTYDHSEKLGDAFEYLLSVLGSQGDAGQFRTPRHIIDFMVQVLDPKKNETVLDPACGTAGFLISAYKHIVKSNQGYGKPLTTQDKQKLYENFTGYDISPDMVRLSLVNLYLHGFVKPQIHEYDSLASEERWNEYADVILANPPFMSPKGGILPHKRFKVQSNRSEVLFVDYMAEHLTPNGRAAIIVPEGIIFQSGGAYKQLRKYLIENNFLWAVVSLPAGAFNPYSGVKTSILFLDKSLAKKTDKVLFVKVDNDGFDLGAQRRLIDRNDLPQALKVLKSLRASILDGKPASFSPETDSPQGAVPTLLVSISKLAEMGDYNLSADRYREVIRRGKLTHPMFALGDVAELVRGITFSKQDQLDYETSDSIRVATTKAAQKEGIVEQDLYYVPKNKVKSDEKLLQEGDILISTANSLNLLGRTTFVPKLNYKASFGAFMTLIRAKKDVINPIYLLHCLRTDFAKSYFLSKANTTTNISNLTFSDLNAFQIPLPSLKLQCQLVDEITAHQRIIDGARQVVESWKYDIGIEHLRGNYETTVKDYVTIQGGYAFKSEWYSKEGIRLLRNANIGHGSIEWDDTTRLPEKRRHEFSDFELRDGDILITLDRPIISTGLKVALVTKEDVPSLLVQRVGRAIIKNESLLPQYFWVWLNSPYFISAIDPGRSITVPHISPKEIESIPFSPPSLEVQREVVAHIDHERAIIEGNRELIRLYEKKIQKTVERIWEG